ncbi:hypothetical protein Pelo_155 [Pelomyxa schiedti]|nr:hypothetical protein Pelo_155 [Pelomyxa schiedti]
MTDHGPRRGAKDTPSSRARGMSSTHNCATAASATRMRTASTSAGRERTGARTDPSPRTTAELRQALCQQWLVHGTLAQFVSAHMNSPALSPHRRVQGEGEGEGEGEWEAEADGEGECGGEGGGEYGLKLGMLTRWVCGAGVRDGVIGDWERGEVEGAVEAWLRAAAPAPAPSPAPSPSPSPSSSPPSRHRPGASSFHDHHQDQGSEELEGGRENYGSGDSEPNGEDGAESGEHSEASEGSLASSSSSQSLGSHTGESDSSADERVSSSLSAGHSGEISPTITETPPLEEAAEKLLSDEADAARGSTLPHLLLWIIIPIALGVCVCCTTFVVLTLWH